MEAAIVGSIMPAEAGDLEPLASKFRSLGLRSQADIQAILRLVKVWGGVSRGDSVTNRQAQHLTVLLSGVACLQKKLEDGSRQIYTFQYPGDFCDLHRYVLPELDKTLAVTALTNCSIGIISHEDMDQMLYDRPKLGLAFWRASMLEASILRERLLNISSRAALPRIASILCEQLFRLEAIDFKSTAIPLTQVHLADAGGLSIVHVNRVVRDLRALGALSNKRKIEVASRERLAQLANFDGKYLNMRDLLSNWKLDLESSG